MASKNPPPDKKARPPNISIDADLLEAMFDAAPFYQSLKEPDGTYIFANKHYIEWLGLEPHELVGKTLEDLTTPTTNIPRIKNAEKKVLETGEPVEQEIRVAQSDGQFHHRILVKYPVFDEDGSVVQIGSCALDISQHKEEQTLLMESEALFRHAFDNAPIGMALIDLEDNRLQVNQALADFLGYSIEELMNTPMSSTNADKDRLARSLELRQQVIDGKIKSYTNKRIYRHKQGHLISGEVTASLVRDENGHPLYFVAHTVDTTQREKDRAALIEAKERAEKASQAKSEFQATMSHELRTPLTSLHGALGLLKGTIGDALPDHSMALLDIAHRNSDRLITLVNDLLDYEKITSGRLKYDLRPCDLNHLILKSVEVNQNYATEFSTRFVYEQTSQPMIANVEERRFEQIMSNLLSNAAKFSKENSIINIELVEVGDALEVSVMDYGVGIPEQELGRIFDRFSQIDSTDSRNRGGTGLGLAITQALTEGMGGRIHVSSEVDSGSTFTVSFPKYVPAP